MEPTYFNTFDEYEKNLELVKAEFQQDEPSWLHYWFYRYLQISPFYWAIHLNQSKLKKDQDQSTIGIILCTKNNKEISKHSVRYMTKPIGVSEYKISEKITDKKIKKIVPSADEIENIKSFKI